MKTHAAFESLAKNLIPNKIQVLFLITLSGLVFLFSATGIPDFFPYPFAAGDTSRDVPRETLILKSKEDQRIILDAFFARFQQRQDEIARNYEIACKIPGSPYKKEDWKSFKKQLEDYPALAEGLRLYVLGHGPALKAK